MLEGNVPGSGRSKLGIAGVYAAAMLMIKRASARRFAVAGARGGDDD